MKRFESLNDSSHFVDLARFALRLAHAYLSWKAPSTGENVFAYFERTNVHAGDEYGLRATLIRDRVLPAFYYDLSEIEYESHQRFDLALWCQLRSERRKVALVETKSSSVRNIAYLHSSKETPVKQLERYLTQAGLYVGVLTNGDEWHVFDFALGSEPLASLSLIELARLLQDVTDGNAAYEQLRSHPSLSQALAIALYYLDARRWQRVDVFRERLANAAYHRVFSLLDSRNVEAFVQNIKAVLGSLRETIRSQFLLLQERYAEYTRQTEWTSAHNSQPFEHVLLATIHESLQFLTPVRDDAVQKEMTEVVLALSREYIETEDMTAFEIGCLSGLSALLQEYHISQTMLIAEAESAPRRTGGIRIDFPISRLSQVKNLVQQHVLFLHSLEKEFSLSKKTIEAYHSWKARVRGIFGNPQDEFCLQTAYIHFVRLFFVRVYEDHDLIPRRISNGPLTTYEQYRLELLKGIKDTYLRLLEETYQRAKTVYNNFFDQKDFFEWFMLDEYTILALFDLLNQYDFQGIRADVLGRVYNEGYIENKERSEKGQFYTPPQVVEYMLDALGIPALHEPDGLKARSFLDKHVGDLSCGSGTFLVAAAARKQATLQHLVQNQEIDADYALQVLTETFLGMDMNPFACYLAEMNMLIQCLPFLRDGDHHMGRSVERFHIYCTDSLEPTVSEQAEAAFAGKVTKRLEFVRQSDGPRSQEDQYIKSIKESRGLPGQRARGCDFLVGNPPYVSASEGTESLLYRDTIVKSGIYQYLHQRWDLFVPFFERNLQFLKPSGGRLALIVSRGIETEGYAELLRAALCDRYSLLQIDFFPGARLFRDAAIETTIVVLENIPPSGEHTVRRRKHLQAHCTDFEELAPLLQLENGELVFRWRYDASLQKDSVEGVIPLCGIAYIGAGIEAQSKETFDTVVDGTRQKLFRLDDVFSLPQGDTPSPAESTEKGVLGSDIDDYYLRRVRSVAYEKYMAKMRRPRHPALFRTPEKLLLGETSGGYYDQQGLFANHSVQVLVPWSALKRSNALEEQGITTVLRESQKIVGVNADLPLLSDAFDMRYLLGIMNSRFMRTYLLANKVKGTRNSRIYPDVWKALPVKIASDADQAEIARRVQKIQDSYRALYALPSLKILLAHPTIQYTSINRYLAQGVLRFVGNVGIKIGNAPALEEDMLLLRRQPHLSLTSSSRLLLQYVELYVTQLEPDSHNWTWADARKHMLAPADLSVLQDVMALVNQRHQTEADLRESIQRAKQEIEQLLEEIYQKAPDPHKKRLINALGVAHTDGQGAAPSSAEKRP